jgi:hypothetical protein
LAKTEGPEEKIFSAFGNKYKKVGKEGENWLK